MANARPVSAPATCLTFDKVPPLPMSVEAKAICFESWLGDEWGLNRVGRKMKTLDTKISGKSLGMCVLLKRNPSILGTGEPR